MAFKVFTIIPDNVTRKPCIVMSTNMKDDQLQFIKLAGIQAEPIFANKEQLDSKSFLELSVGLEVFQGQFLKLCLADHEERSYSKDYKDD